MIVAPFHRLGWLGLALFLAACEVPLAVQQLPEMTFRHLAPISLKVADFQVVDKARTAATEPHVGHRLPTPPLTAMKRWAEDRIRTSGRSGTARFTILAADVTETRLTVDTGFTGLFKKQVSDRYDGRVEGSLEIYDHRGARRALVTARASRSLTMLEDVTLDDRRRQLYEFVEKMMGDFNRALEENIRRHMTEYIL